MGGTSASFSSTLSSGVITVTNSVITGIGLNLVGTAYSGHTWALGDGITTNTTFSIKDITSGVEALKITSAGAATFTSSVTSQATSSAVFIATSATTNRLYSILANTGNNSYFGIESSTGGSLFTGGSAYATVLGTDAARSLQFATSSNIRLTIASTGNVLIGTTTDNASKLQVAGNLSLTTAGNKILIQTGTNASVGLSTLVGGTVTVSTTAVTSNSGIMLTCRTVGGTQGLLRISTITGGTSFVITSSSALDTSQIAWLIIN